MKQLPNILFTMFRLLISILVGVAFGGFLFSILAGFLVFIWFILSFIFHHL